MASLYTLKNALDGERAVLNGKVLMIRVKDGKLAFVDALTREVLWLTTSVKEKSVTDDKKELTVVTSSGSKYEFLNVLSMVPTAAGNSINTIQANIIEKPKKVELPSKLDIDRTPVTRQINYGDGYDGTVYKFDTELSYEQFLELCRRENNKLAKLDDYAWYEDHAMVTPSSIISDQRISSYDNPEGKPGDVSKVWTYLWVRAYTD